jgi:protocatechuate 3,4-dioxygenase beta subunit
VHVVDANGPLPGATIEYVGRRSVADTTGTVRLRGLHHDNNQLTASAPGHALAAVQVLAEGDPHTVLERTITLVPGTSVDGIVLAPDGAPLAGAAVEVWGTWQAHVFTATSDAHGAWRVDGLETGRASVSAHTERYPEGKPVKVEVDAAAPVHGVVVQMIDGAELDGTVADAAGAPVANARVIGWRTTTWDLFDVTTDASGRFARPVMPGAFRVIAIGADRSAPPVDVAVSGRASVALVVVPSRIAGTVVDGHGVPVAEARVVAKSSELWPTYLTEPETRTDGHGRFAFGSIAPGTYTIQAAPPGHGDEAIAETSVATGTLDVVIVTPALATISGRVRVHGEPATEVSTQINNAFETSHAGDGRFTRTGISAGDPTIKISAPHAQVVERHVHVEPGAAIDLGDIELDGSRHVSGHVTLPDGTPVAGAVVIGGDASDGYVEPPTREHIEGFVAVTDATGAYAAEDVGVGELSVRATFQRTQTTETVGAPAGDAVVDLVMLPTGTVVVSVVGSGIKSVGIRDSAGEMSTSYGFADDVPPELEFSLLHAGGYTIDAQRGDGTELPDVIVTVVANETVRATIGP